MVAPMEAIQVHLTKLGHLKHLSVACNALTLTCLESHGQLPPSLDIASAKQIGVNGQLLSNLDPQRVTLPANDPNAQPPQLWRLKIGHPNELDLGVDDLVAVSAADAPPN